MASSGNDGAGKYLGSHLASAQIASQIGTQTYSRLFGMDSDTMSAIHKLTGVSSQIEAIRTTIIGNLFPAAQMTNTYYKEMLSPGISSLVAQMNGIQAVQRSFAQSSEFQEMAATLTNIAGFNSVVTDTLGDSMRIVVDASKFTSALFETPAMSETFAAISQFNADLGNFAQIYSQTTQPLLDSLQAAYEGTKLFDNFDFSVIDDIDEDAFEEFLDEHPELEETYEAIEETLVRRGLISKETFSRAGALFKSSIAAKQLMIAVIMFSAGAALMFGVKSLPDDLEDEGVMYMGIVGFMYTAYSLHSMVKKSVTPPDAE